VSRFKIERPSTYRLLFKDFGIPICPRRALTRIGEHSVQFAPDALDSMIRRIVRLVAPNTTGRRLRLTQHLLPFDIDDSEMGLGVKERRGILIARLVVGLLRDFLGAGVDLIESAALAR
jgi:hypothetical protein